MTSAGRAMSGTSPDTSRQATGTKSIPGSARRDLSGWKRLQPKADRWR